MRDELLLLALGRQDPLHENATSLASRQESQDTSTKPYRSCPHCHEGLGLAVLATAGLSRSETSAQKMME